MTMNQNESKLVSIFVEGTLYGAFFVMFILTYWTLVLRRPQGRDLNKAMLAVSVTMFVLATTHIIVNLIRTLQAFFGERDRTKSYWDQLSEPHVLSTAIYFAQTLVGDGVAIYRCWVVWGRREIYILPPVLFFLGSIMTGIGTLVSLSRERIASIFTHRVWLTAFFSFTLAASTICTLMIAMRIWVFNRKTFNSQPGGNLYPIMRVVLESGAIYPGALVALLVLLQIRSWFQYVLVDSITPIVGLVFSIIIVRVGLGITTDGPSPPPTPTDSFDNYHADTVKTSHRPKSSAIRFSQDSVALASSQFWPTQPDRPLNLPQHKRESTKRSIFSPKRGSQKSADQGHYNLRSQVPYPISYFRVSEEMEVDVDLEVEMDEARYERPRPLPPVLMLPRSEHVFTQ